MYKSLPNSEYRPIDCSPIDYKQLYAQTIYDLHKRERYWFDTENEIVTTVNNQEFHVMPIAEQLFHEYLQDSCIHLQYCPIWKYESGGR